MPSMTIVNGTATRIVRFFRPVSAVAPPPPISSMIAATAPVSTPQMMTTLRLGSRVPFCESVPMTMDAASAPETKKMPTRIITMRLVTLAIGYSRSTAKSWPSAVDSSVILAP
jgi:hypothetical protein